MIDEQKSVLKQNLSKQEFTELQKIIVNKNEIHVVNDTDKNLGAAISDKEDVVNECKRQLYDIATYFKLSVEQMEMLIDKFNRIWKKWLTNIKFEKIAIIKKRHLFSAN